MYKGTLVHYLVHRLRKGVDPELLLQKETSRQLYKDLLTAVLQSEDETRRRGAAPKRHNQPVDDLTVHLDARLQLLVDLEDFKYAAFMFKSQKRLFQIIIDNSNNIW